MPGNATDFNVWVNGEPRTVAQDTVADIEGRVDRLMAELTGEPRRAFALRHLDAIRSRSGVLTDRIENAFSEAGPCGRLRFFGLRRLLWKCVRPYVARMLWRQNEVNAQLTYQALLLSDALLRLTPSDDAESVAASRGMAEMCPSAEAVGKGAC